MTINFNIELSASQKEAYELVHNDDIKFLTLVMSRQSGKSVLMKLLCIEYLLMIGEDIGYVCRNYILAKKLFRDICQLIPSNLIKSANGSDLTITSIMNSTLTFYSAESANALRGLTFTKLINDEFAFFKFELPDGSHLWNDILYPTIKARADKVIFVSTPFGKNNLLYEMYQKGNDDNYPNYVSLKKTIYDDGFVTPQQIDEIKKSIPELSFRQEFLCEFLDNGCSFFTSFEKAFSQDYKFDDSLPTYIGIDLSSYGSDATILTKVNTNNDVYQLRSLGTLDCRYKEISECINNTKNLKGVYIEINGIGAPMFNEIKKLVKDKSILYEWLTTNKSKEEIISELAVAIENGDLHINTRFTKLFDEFSTFQVQYSNAGNLIFNAKSGYHDDRVMSLAIALRCKKDKTNKGKYLVY